MENERITAQTSDLSEGRGVVGNEVADVSEQAEGEETGAVFSDSESPASGEKQPQSAKTNAEYAQRRRETEQKRARREQETIERERRTAREAAILEVLDHINPYTGEEMTDARDVEEYLTMKEIDKQGGDPLGDFSRFQKKRQREQERTEEEDRKRDEWYREDRERFLAAYPDVDLEALVGDEEFRLFAEGKTGERPLAEIYEGYLSLIRGRDRQARHMAAHMLANKKASPGALSHPNAGEQDFFSAEDVRRMSAAEVHKNYDTIMRSMKQW